MPVVINDFEVVENGHNRPEQATPPPPQQPAPRPLSGRQIAQMMRALKERAKRLHAD